MSHTRKLIFILVLQICYFIIISNFWIRKVKSEFEIFYLLSNIIIKNIICIFIILIKWPMQKHGKKTPLYIHFFYG